MDDFGIFKEKIKGKGHSEVQNLIKGTNMKRHIRLT